MERTFFLFNINSTNQSYPCSSIRGHTRPKENGTAGPAHSAPCQGSSLRCSSPSTSVVKVHQEKPCQRQRCTFCSCLLILQLYLSLSSCWLSSLLSVHHSTCSAHGPSSSPSTLSLGACWSDLAVTLQTASREVSCILGPLLCIHASAGFALWTVSSARQKLP